MKTVFTNGCFDIIHRGHVDLLEMARERGDRLVVGINSDSSVRKIKGPGRPVNSADARKRVLEALRAVDEVIIFEELTPENLIKNIKPDVLVKGGDWKESEIVGAAFVKSNGGEVFTIPFVQGYSTSLILDSLRSEGDKDKGDGEVRKGADGGIAGNSLAEHIGVLGSVADGMPETIEECAAILYRCVVGGGKVLLCGNGGSAADAQHIAAEFVGRYEAERRALPAVALTTDTSAITALANDYDFAGIFERQVEALATPGDVLVAISTSGNSENVIRAMMKARERGCTVIGMTGSEGTKFAGLCDACVSVPSRRTARIQEAHITIAHIWCEIVESRVAGEGK